MPSGPNAANQVDNVTPAETIKSGWDKYNAHWHEYDGVLLTNSAAGSTAVGDVLAVSAAGDSAAILGDTSASLQKYVIAMAVIANAATGEFARSGVVSAKAQGAIARGQYVQKSATARAIEDAGVAIGATATPPQGALGIALAAAAGGVCTILLFVKAADGAAAATQAQMEAASSTTVYASPGRTQYHPGVAKGWVKFNDAGTIAASYNVTSITDNGVGSWDVNWDIDFSSAEYSVLATSGNGAAYAAVDTSPTAGVARINGVLRSDGTPSDLVKTFVAAFGDQ